MWSWVEGLVFIGFKKYVSRDRLESPKYVMMACGTSKRECTDILHGFVHEGGRASVYRVPGLARIGGVQVSGFASLRLWLRDLGVA